MVIILGMKKVQFKRTKNVQISNNYFGSSLKLLHDVNKKFQIFNHKISLLEEDQSKFLDLFFYRELENTFQLLLAFGLKKN